MRRVVNYLASQAFQKLLATAIVIAIFLAITVPWYKVKFHLFDDSPVEEHYPMLSIPHILNSSELCLKVMPKEKKFMCDWLYDDPGVDINDREQVRKQMVQTQPPSIEPLYSKALAYYFRVRMTDSQRKLLLEITRDCLHIMDLVNQPHFLVSGTLIGYMRHNKSIIPWDDDMDIALPIRRPDWIPKAVADIQKAAKTHFSDSLVMHFIPEWSRIKCSYTTEPSKYFDKYAWRWPFIDFQFFRFRRIGVFHLETYSQDMNVGIKFPRDIVFPTKPVKFTEMNIPTQIPQNPEKYLEHEFGNYTKMCYSPGYCHFCEEPYKYVVKAPCTEVKNLVTF